MEYFAKKTENHQITSENDSFIFIKTEYRLERVDIDDILYIEGMKDYLRIYLY